MSYILDALRKAERERRVSPVPTLDAAHEGPARGRRQAWPWALTGALAVNAVAIYGLWGLWGFWASGPPDSVRQALAPAPPVAGLESPAKTAPAPASPQVSLSSARAEQGAGQAPVAPARGPAVAPEPIAPPARVAPVPAPARAPDAPRVPDGARAGLPRDGLVEGAEPRTPGAGRARSPLSGAPGESAIGQRPVPPAPGAPAVSPAQVAPAAPVVPAAPPALALAPAPSPAAGPGRVAPAGPADSLALALDVLVYSELPAERLVFINGRKYVEGQAVTGDVVVEQITPDGAILRRADQRIMLRPKLNPYTRPGSP